jgi:hypothetical protein
MGKMEILRVDFGNKKMPKAGFEPAHREVPPPQDGVSTNSTTSAFMFYILYRPAIYRRMVA